MAATTPIGTWTWRSRSPFGRVCPRITVPTGSGSAARFSRARGQPIDPLGVQRQPVQHRVGGAVRLALVQVLGVGQQHHVPLGDQRVGDLPQRLVLPGPVGPWPSAARRSGTRTAMASTAAAASGFWPSWVASAVDWEEAVWVIQPIFSRCATGSTTAEVTLRFRPAGGVVQSTTRSSTWMISRSYCRPSDAASSLVERPSIRGSS